MRHASRRLLQIPRSLFPLAAAVALGLAPVRAADADAPESSPRAIPEWMAELDSTPGVTGRAITPTSAIVAWPAKLGGDGRLRIERLRLYLDADRALARQWDEWTHATVARTGDTFTATLTRLAPQQPHYLRVLPLDGSGTPGQQLFAIRFETPAKAPVFTLLRTAWIFLTLLLAALVWMRVRARL